jgi:hypothetical protein
VAVTHQAFRFELDPGSLTRGAMASHAGGARFAYGWGLRLVKSGLDQGARIRESALIGGASDRGPKRRPARSVCRGRCPPCAGSGTRPSATWRPGGRRTPRAVTAAVSMARHVDWMPG